jgi:hypothetical protein
MGREMKKSAAVLVPEYYECDNCTCEIDACACCGKKLFPSDKIYCDGELYYKHYCKKCKRKIDKEEK